jgi:hypothetical protein
MISPRTRPRWRRQGRGKQLGGFRGVVPSELPRPVPPGAKGDSARRGQSPIITAWTSQASLRHRRALNDVPTPSDGGRGQPRRVALYQRLELSKSERLPQVSPQRSGWPIKSDGATRAPNRGPRIRQRSPPHIARVTSNYSCRISWYKIPCELKRVLCERFVQRPDAG